MNTKVNSKGINLQSQLHLHESYTFQKSFISHSLKQKLLPGFSFTNKLLHTIWEQLISPGPLSLKFLWDYLYQVVAVECMKIPHAFWFGIVCKVLFSILKSFYDLLTMTIRCNYSADVLCPLSVYSVMCPEYPDLPQALCSPLPVGYFWS